MSNFSFRNNDRNSDKVSGINSATPAPPKDISDCISSWVAYLQMLSGLCNAGSRLSHSLTGLLQDTIPNNRMMMMQCQTMWEELVKASTVASSNIKSQILSTLQEYSLMNDAESDIQRTSQIIYSSLVSFINLQYQLSAACCEYLGPIAGCNCDLSQKHEPDCSVGMIQQCFQRLFPYPSFNSIHKGVKSPSHLSILQVAQRRWSEAAAQEVAGSGDTDGSLRRWSMPWETSKLTEHSSGWPGRLHSKPKLTVPIYNSQERSRSVTPESVWHSSMTSQEELQEVIKLLSCPVPSVQTSLYQPNPKSQVPGVTLTGCSLDVFSHEPWSESTTPGSRRGSHSPHRGSWTVPESISHTWSESMSGTESNYELNPATFASRKSSSSTDSSSSHSLHSRSTTGSLSGASGSSESGGMDGRPQLYSMWSGADLPFIKLPDANETIKESSSEPQVGPENRNTLYLPKSH
ncbi:hypothetical protein Phum_PHUM582420 [Pediculus humanus corporis]|uniref:DUF4745 domain-containing protein n=1 Tax=Pediculus humanus subsp. corporis TaxID=121224 RepID=E0W1T5_PEDHC|nr:uncharacterized protein Phum_PHUM582420 [Pediculus humanus corporis]EEB19667.1 hypothetical protein Phum_PHUM582420 [Pediculus humanus corporis]